MNVLYQPQEVTMPTAEGYLNNINLLPFVICSGLSDELQVFIGQRLFKCLSRGDHIAIVLE